MIADMDETTPIEFEVEDYRKGTIVTRIVFDPDSGEWTAATPFGESLIESARKLFDTDEKRIEHFSSFTNQSHAYRRVED